MSAEGLAGGVAVLLFTGAFVAVMLWSDGYATSQRRSDQRCVATCSPYRKLDCSEIENHTAATCATLDGGAEIKWVAEDGSK